MSVNKPSGCTCKRGVLGSYARCPVHGKNAKIKKSPEEKDPLQEFADKDAQEKTRAISMWRTEMTRCKNFNYWYKKYFKLIG